VATTSPPAANTQRHPGRVYVGLGIALVILGPILYMVQLWARILRTPWYVPVLATAGVALAFVAVLRRPNVWRILALAFCLAFAFIAWQFILVSSKLPAYTGPVATGVTLPAFTATLADGSPFNQDSLRGEQNTAMVFFRGRW